MKPVTVCIVSLGLCAWLLAADAPAAAPRRPPVTLKEAIDLADSYAKQHKMDLSQHYLQAVRLISGRQYKDGRAWLVTWEKAEQVDDDEVDIIVQMDKTVDRRPRG